MSHHLLSWHPQLFLNFYILLSIRSQIAKHRLPGHIYSPRSRLPHACTHPLCAACRSKLITDRTRKPVLPKSSAHVCVAVSFSFWYIRRSTYFPHLLQMPPFEKMSVSHLTCRNKTEKEWPLVLVEKKDREEIEMAVAGNAKN